MRKALFLPFLTIQTGHHQVADALMAFVSQHSEDVEVKKVDLLHYASPIVERVISQSYLSWIQYAPSTFTKVYDRMFDKPLEEERNFKLYEMLLKHLIRLLDEEKPDIIFCTQSAPSYLLNKLKQSGKCNVPVVNVYTDFFMSKLWGTSSIDYHFVPMKEMKEQLKARGVEDCRIFLTGIPVHEEMLRTTSLHNYARNVLIAGGNSGLMDSTNLYEQLKSGEHFHYYVLCGNNLKLFKQISSWQLPNVTPLPYIKSRTEMNQLYDQMDAIVTKPGGVTISEALRKRLPIFVHSVLPGQEERNLRYLTERGLAYTLNRTEQFHTQLENVLLNETIMKAYKRQASLYLSQLHVKTADEWIQFMQSMIHQPLEKEHYISV